jgi:hypothetical protein
MLRQPSRFIQKVSQNSKLNACTGSSPEKKWPPGHFLLREIGESLIEFSYSITLAS